MAKGEEEDDRVGKNLFMKSQPEVTGYVMVFPPVDSHFAEF